MMMGRWNLKKMNKWKLIKKKGKLKYYISIELKSLKKTNGNLDNIFVSI